MKKSAVDDNPSKLARFAACVLDFCFSLAKGQPLPGSDARQGSIRVAFRHVVEGREKELLAELAKSPFLRKACIELPGSTQADIVCHSQAALADPLAMENFAGLTLAQAACKLGREDLATIIEGKAMAIARREADELERETPRVGGSAKPHARL